MSQQAPASIWVVQGEHPTTPGRPMTAHATEAGAKAQAAELVGLILGDSELDPQPPEPTADNWEQILEFLQDFHGVENCDVWITQLDVNP